MQGTFDALKMVSYSLWGAWFIDVILVQYLIFFITWKITKGKPNAWIALSFLGSIIAAIVFMVCGLNARWYNGLMLFPFGMLIANKEKELMARIERKWNMFLLITMVLFALSGGIFTYFKGSIIGIDCVKMFSGMCLSILVCIVFWRIKLCSKIMLYIGKRSLYFYLVHVNLLSVLGVLEEIKGIQIFYMVLGLTFLVVWVAYEGIGILKQLQILRWEELKIYACPIYFGWRFQIWSAEINDVINFIYEGLRLC